MESCWGVLGKAVCYLHCGVWRFECNVCTFKTQTASDGCLAQRQANLGVAKTGQVYSAWIAVFAPQKYSLTVYKLEKP